MVIHIGSYSFVNKYITLEEIGHVAFPECFRPRYLAMSEGGVWRFYEEKPYWYINDWCCDGNSYELGIYDPEISEEVPHKMRHLVMGDSVLKISPYFEVIEMHTHNHTTKILKKVEVQETVKYVVYSSDVIAVEYDFEEAQRIYDTIEVML